MVTQHKEPPPKACSGTSSRILQRVRRGFFPKRSGDILAVERAPNQFTTRHSTPWPYTQNVPLVLYGPGFIKGGFTSDADVTLADVAPTYAELLDFHDLGARDGRSRDEALLAPDERTGAPKLILTVVWDGAGDNALERWPDSWPYLRSLMKKGASFTNATVGSSPSITPAVHATLGTGDFPRKHGLTDGRVRIGGELVDPWEDDSPANLRVETLADLWDRANGNVPLIGTLARDAWHLGMIGHGSYIEGGDRDIAILDSREALASWSNTEYYTLPAYMQDFEVVAEAIEEVDRRDGEADGLWLGHPLRAAPSLHKTPAWSIQQTQRLFRLLETEGFGADEVPDLFFTNYKSVDLAGHIYNLVEPEVRANIEELDRQLKLIVHGLNELVGRDGYVLALTADHGMTPYAEVTGGWPIVMSEIRDDIDERFNSKRPNESLIASTRGYQFFLDSAVMRANQVTPRQIAAFIRNYRLHENATDLENLPERFQERLNERIYLTAMTPAELRRSACSRG
ncbi:MAG: alkaline phosphatase family protein [Actinomycetota bacterium]